MKDIIINIYLLVCACIGLIYGLTAMYRKKQPLYFKLMVFPIACQVFSRAFYTITLLCYGELPSTFNIGFLGFATFFLFLYFPNVGTIDNLVDEKKERFTKYRMLPIIVPTLELAVAIVAFFFDYAQLPVRIFFIILTLFAGLAGYFNMKHLIIPDVEDGIINSLRRFNLVCLIFEVLSLSEIGLYCFDLQSPVIFVQALLGVFYIAFLPFLSKEARKWIQ